MGILIPTRRSTRTNHHEDGSFNAVASMREQERINFLAQQYEDRRNAECVDPDFIARRAEKGIAIKQALATRPIPKHRALTLISGDKD